MASEKTCMLKVHFPFPIEKIPQNKETQNAGFLVVPIGSEGRIGDSPTQPNITDGRPR